MRKIPKFEDKLRFCTWLFQKVFGQVENGWIMVEPTNQPTNQTDSQPYKMATLTNPVALAIVVSSLCLQHLFHYLHTTWLYVD